LTAVNYLFTNPDDGRASTCKNSIANGLKEN